MQVKVYTSISLTQLAWTLVVLPFTVKDVQSFLRQDSDLPAPGLGFFPVLDVRGKLGQAIAFSCILF